MKIKPYYIRVRPSPMTGVFIKRGKFGDRDTQGKGHVTLEAEVRVTYPQDKETKVGQSPPEARREARDHFSLRASTRNCPYQHGDFRLLASTTVENNFLCVQSPKRVVICYSSPRK